MPTRRIRSVCAREPNGETAAVAARSAMTSRRSFDHLVGAGEQGGWDVEAKRFGGVEVDDEIEFGRLLHWQIAWFRAVQDFVHVTCRTPPKILATWPITQERPRSGDLYELAHDRKPVARGDHRDLRAPADLDAIACRDDRISARIGGGPYGGLEILRSPGRKGLQIQS